MKHLGFWLLVLLAVLVPATASIATSMICPTVSVAAKAQARGLAVKTEAVAKHAAAGSHARVAWAGAKPQAKPGKKPDTTGQQADHCCDASPCSQCAGCSTCGSFAATAELGANARPGVVALLPEGSAPRAEFLLAGQERPPRTT